MELYLMRHGIAAEPFEWKGDDASRPLTDEGWEKTRRVLEAIQKKQHFKPKEIWSSPLVRAQQTAQIAAEVLKLKVKNCDALACGASVSGLQEFFKKHKLGGAALWVGHEPDMGEMYADLSGLRSSDPFKKASIALLKGEFKPGKMKAEYKLAPAELLD